MSGNTVIALNTVTSTGAILGVDNDAGGTSYQVMKLGFSDSGTTPVQLGPSNLFSTYAGTIAVTGFPSTQVVTGTMSVLGTTVVSLAGINGTVNIVGTIPVTGTVSAIVSISGGNAAASLTGQAVPTSADYLGWNSGGNLVGVAAANPLPISLTGANGTVNVVGNVPVTLTGANGTVNIVGNVPVTLTGANGTVNIVGNVPVTLTGANGTVNVVGTVPTQGSFVSVETGVATSTPWTSGAAGNSTLVASAVGFGNAAMGVTITGSVTGGVLTFEGSIDGSTWVPLSVQLLGGSTAPALTYALSGGAATWQTFVGGLNQVRIRLSTQVVGSGTATVWIRPSVCAAELANYVYQPTAANLNATVTGTMSVTGTTVTSLAGVNGTVNIVGTVPVAGTMSIAGTAAVTGTMSISGTAAVTGTMSVTGTSVVTGTMSITGTSVVTGTMSITGTTVVSLAGANGTVNIVGTIPVNIIPLATQGWSKWSSLKNNTGTPLTSTGVIVRAAACELGGYIVFNVNTVAAYIQVFDSATTTNILGTSSADILIPIPASSGANLEMANGVNFTNGIVVGATSGTTGNAAPSSGIVASFFYK